MVYVLFFCSKEVPRRRYPTNKVMGRGLIDYIPLMEIRRNFKKNKKNKKIRGIISYGLMQYSHRIAYVTNDFLT